MSGQLWTVILAAGAGRRLAEVIGGVPKQFWRGAQGRSLLGQTMDRFVPLAPRSRTVVIVDAGHLDHVAASDVRSSVPALVIQPEDRGTAAGVLLALTPVLEHAPDSIVVITPSDHGVVDDAAFRRGVLYAARQVRAHGDVVLFGVEPAAAHQDYGWISFDALSTMRGFRAVTSFVEKPASDLAARLLAAGAVWNTMVIVARARAIRDLYLKWLPELSKAFASAWRQPKSVRAAFFASVYPALPRLDFSRDLLGAARGLSAYVWPASVGWSDLGTPDRLAEWHERASVPGVTHAITAA